MQNAVKLDVVALDQTIVMIVYTTTTNLKTIHGKKRIFVIHLLHTQLTKVLDFV